ncbi:MAG: DNA repair protein RecO C-terminal domain-containing protein, partial [Bacteroidales bacterium]
SKTKQKTALYLPLTLLDMQVYHSKKQQIQYIKEAKIAYPYQNIYTQIQKSTVVVFLAEVLQKCLNEEEADVNLFRFLYQSLIDFDKETAHYADFHLLFLVDLSRYLGFAPQMISSALQTKASLYFDLREACFISCRPTHPDYVENENAILLKMLFNYSTQTKPVAFCAEHRSFLLKCLIRYYALHLSDMGEIRSLDILHEVFTT